MQVQQLQPSRQQGIPRLMSRAPHQTVRSAPYIMRAWLLSEHASPRLRCLRSFLVDATRLTLNAPVGDILIRREAD